MLLEFWWGFFSNSLGLIVDSVHMMFDCLSLSVSLIAVYMKNFKPNSKFTFGFRRFETISVFVNGIFLVFTSMFVVFEGLRRLIDPPNIYTNNLLFVSTLGLIVNLVGVIFFYFQQTDDSPDIVAVLFHMIADTLGSISVIVSTIIIIRYELLIADPICSFFISGIILASSLGLLKDSTPILFQKSPKGIDHTLTNEIEKLPVSGGSLKVLNIKCWALTLSSNVITLSIQIPKQENEQKVLKMVIGFLKDKSFGEENITVEIRK